MIHVDPFWSILAMSNNRFLGNHQKPWGFSKQLGDTMGIRIWSGSDPARSGWRPADFLKKILKLFGKRMWGAKKSEWSMRAALW